MTAGRLPVQHRRRQAAPGGSLPIRCRLSAPPPRLRRLHFSLAGRREQRILEEATELPRFSLAGRREQRILEEATELPRCPDHAVSHPMQPEAQDAVMTLSD